MSLSRIIVIIAALIVASVVACAALAFGIIAADMDSNPIERVSFFAGSFFATSYFGAVTIVPAFVLIVLGETLRMRSEYLASCVEPRLDGIIFHSYNSRVFPLSPSIPYPLDADLSE